MNRFDLLSPHALAMGNYDYIKKISPTPRVDGNPYYWRLIEALEGMVRYGDIYRPAREQMLEGMR